MRERELDTKRRSRSWKSLCICIRQRQKRKHCNTPCRRGGRHPVDHDCMYQAEYNSTDSDQKMLGGKARWRPCSSPFFRHSVLNLKFK